MSNSFLRDTRGNVAMMFGLCFVGLIGLAGLAVDYSRQQATTMQIQSAVDQVGLSLALQARTMTPAQIQAKATELYLASTGSKGLVDNTVTAVMDMTRSPPRLVVNATPKFVTSFGKLFGMPHLPAYAKAEVPIVANSIEIALVLDNTGSMGNNGKLSELKKASKNLIDIVKNAGATSGARARISIVPFAVQVKIGTSAAAQSWIDWAYFPYDRSTWNGCVQDRSPPYDTKNTIPDGDTFTWYPASNCSVVEMMPLSDNWTALSQRIDDMYASGTTNVTIGTAWGYNMLTFGAPLSTAEPPSPLIARYMIVLTDGMNTQNRWTTNGVLIDARTEQACANAKADGITIYSVRVINGNPNLIASCASGPDKFYNINKAEDLNGVFEGIARQMMTSIYLGN